MSDNDQHRGADARGEAGARSVRIGRTAVTGWALAAVLVVAGFGTAMGATPVAVAQPVAVADTADTGPAAVLDPLDLLPTARPLSPAAVMPILPTIASAPTATVTETATAGTPTASVPAAQLRKAEFTTDAPDTRASAAIRTALAQIGLPYVWGGNGPTNGDAGFDCSGLTTFSYGSAGVPLPRTAHTQYNAGPHVPDGVPLQPGDLVFYGTTARVHHVGMYLGAGRMVNAPTFGKPVQVAFYRYRGDDYLGATRPAAAPGSLTSGILPYVDPAQLPPIAPSVPQIFTAPTAPMVTLPQPGDTSLPPEQVSAAWAIQESDAVAVKTVVAQPTAVAGATTSASAPVTTAPAAPAPVEAGVVGTSTSTPPVSGAPVAGTTTSTSAPAAPVASTTSTTATTPATTPATSAPVTSTTPAPVRTTTSPKPAPATKTKKKNATAPKTSTTSAATKTTTTAKATTAPSPAEDDTTTAKAVKTTEDDETSAEKSTKTSEKTTEEKAEETTEKSSDADDKEASDDSSDSSDDGGDG
jgi:cell wall-associated NlpC family hydrolase